MDLVILAAGMGSRFGGLKQIEPMNDNGEFIIDYSIFDAIRCGFDKVVFIIKKELEKDFKETVGKRIEEKIKVEYVFQDINDLPEGFTVPEGRVKPWGTGHAILACKNTVKNDFAIINADDFYGHDAFKCASELMKKPHTQDEYGIVCYKCKNTLSENNAVKRGVCSIENGQLKSITESSVEKRDGKYWATPLDTTDTKEVDPYTPVSMNMWCFTPKLFDYLENQFPVFLKNNIDKNPLKCEYLIPSIVDEMINKNLVTVSAVETQAQWYGITYKEDKDQVVSALKEMTNNGEYPQNLWS